MSLELKENKRIHAQELGLNRLRAKQNSFLGYALVAMRELSEGIENGYSPQKLKRLAFAVTFNLEWLEILQDELTAREA